MAGPLVSVVILNFNGQAWLARCLQSLNEQTIFKQTQVIVADNGSTDGSDKLAAEWLARWPDNAVFVQNGENLGYCEGNNRGAAAARGAYLFFLNNDTWLENDCLEKLLSGAEAASAASASPMVLNYDDDSFQTNGAGGFDLFGYLTGTKGPLKEGVIFGAPGCALLIKTEVFHRLGGFDARFFMYADETDLAWRLALAGYKTVTIPAARLHHRSAAAANPKGGGRVVEFRTTEMVRFYSTRNSLLVLLKNAQHVLLGLAVLQSAWTLVEAAAVLILVRSWKKVRRAYFAAFADCWRLRGHVRSERRRLRALRRHGDFWMLRFLLLRPGRWNEIEKLLKFGPPKMD